MCPATPIEGDAQPRPDTGEQSVDAEVRRRIEEALGHESFRRMGADLHLHSETIRRQLRGEAGVSLRVLAAVCSKTGVSADWLLFGRGPRTDSERVEHVLRTAPMRLLLAALAERMQGSAARAGAEEPPVQPAQTAHSP